MSTIQRRRRWPRVLVALLGLLLVAASLVAWLAGGGPRDAPVAASLASTPELVAHGAYLAKAGNCAGCHSARGGPAWAGGTAIATPFGTVYAGNLTPDQATGLGRWTADDFWRALHLGQSRDGRFLLPAFPYAQYTQVSREDADALWAFLRSLPAVQLANRPHDLRWPYRSAAALAVWRALYFRAAEFTPEPGHGTEWNRGAYLVRGLGHCAACHAERNALGAIRHADDLGGGQIPMQGWYAPSLASPHEAGVAQWPIEDIVALLRDGRSGRHAVLGPMAAVVFRSTQFLQPEDLRAIAVHLRDLPQSAVPREIGTPATAAVLASGSMLFDTHCAGCHAPEAAGAASEYPLLAGQRSLTMNSPANLIKVVLAGGFAPATAGNPRPYGMPPFASVLTDDEIAALVSYLRQHHGGGASAVTPLDVQRLR